MSKIICDVCGTSYADTADQCPICGTAKTDVTPGATEGGESGYAYVKGGRFSQNNVRKHNSGDGELPRTTDEEKPARKPRAARKEETPAPTRRPRSTEESGETPKPVRRPRNSEKAEDEQPSNLPLIIIVAVLLVAILAVCAYIGVFVYNKYVDRDLSADNNPSSSTDVGGQTVPCTGVTIDGLESYTFTGINESYMLSVNCDPAGTTDELIWDFDENVVALEKVGNYWYLSPVAPGETTVTVTCGEFSDSITIHCDFVGRIPCTDITIEGQENYTITDGSQTLTLTVGCAPLDTNDEIKWQYDEAVVSVTANDDGTWSVTPVAPGVTTVTVICGDQSATINVNCNYQPKPNFVLTWACGTDITLAGYGTSWVIYNGSLDVGEITFTSSNEEVATVVGNRVYIWKNGQATITATYEDQRITMIVRAKNVEPPVEGVPVCYIYSQYGKIQGECTIRVGATLTLSLRDENGVKLDGVVFTVANETYLSLTDNKITAVSPIHGGTYVYAEYEGHTYKVLIRVYEAENADTTE